MTPEAKKILGHKRAVVSHLILNEMNKRNWTMTTFAESIGCSVANVSTTINGRGHSYMVLDGLRRMGVSDHLLFDPRDIRFTANYFNGER